MGIRDTRTRMYIPSGGIRLNNELRIVGLLDGGGSSYTYKAQRNSGEFVVLKEFYPINRDIYVRNKEGFLKYNDTMGEQQKEEERAVLAEWISAERNLAGLAGTEGDSNADYVFFQDIVELEDGKTDSAFFEIRTVKGSVLTEWCNNLGNSRTRKAAILRVMLKICDTVERLHEKRIIHCDLKPGNIYVTESGNIYILDFGTSVYRTEDGEFIYSEIGIGGVSDGYSSMRIRSLGSDKSKENISGIDESDDIYSLVQMVFRLLLGSTVDQIIFDTPPDKSFEEYVGELADSHLEAQHLLRISRLLYPENILFLKDMANIHTCLEDLLRTENLLASGGYETLDSLMERKTFHTLMSLLEVTETYVRAARNSREESGGHFVLDDRDVLVEAGDDDGCHLHVARLCPVAELDDELVSDEADDVRGIISFFNGAIQKTGEPICDGINCVGRRKLAKLRDETANLTYGGLETAIRELKGYCNPNVTYLESNVSDVSGLTAIYMDKKSNIEILSRIMGSMNEPNQVCIHTDNFTYFFNELIELLRLDDDSVICIMNYDDMDMMVERIPVTIPYGGYNKISVVSDNIKIDVAMKLYIIMWGTDEAETYRKNDVIYDFLSGKNGKLTSKLCRVKPYYIYVDAKLTNANMDIVYGSTDKNVDVNASNIVPLMKFVLEYGTYGIPYNVACSVVEDVALQDIIKSNYLAYIGGQVFVTNRGLDSYTGSIIVEDAYKMLCDTIMHKIILKEKYEYNDILTIYYMFKKLGNKVELSEDELIKIESNVPYRFFDINLRDMIKYNTGISMDYKSNIINYYMKKINAIVSHNT